jgi:hypothetical protein
MRLPSVPSDLALEKRINPFLRVIAFDVAWIDDLTQFAKHQGACHTDTQTPVTPVDAFHCVEF